MMLILQQIFFGLASLWATLLSWTASSWTCSLSSDFWAIRLSLFWKLVKIMLHDHQNHKRHSQFASRCGGGARSSHVGSLHVGSALLKKCTYSRAAAAL
jgi:hypothetical protein